MKKSNRSYISVIQIISLILLVPTFGFAQMLRLDLTDIERQSMVIVHAQTVSLQAKWEYTASGRNIITTARLKVLEAIKGIPTAPEQVEISVPGGTIADTTQWVTSSVQFHLNEEVILFLKGDPLQVTGEFQGKYSIFNDQVQIGNLAVDKAEFMNILKKNVSNPNLLPEYLAVCKAREMTGENLDRKLLLKSENSGNTAQIISISPDKTSAGTNTDVTITGTNFGSTQGTGSVGFFFQTGYPKIIAPVVSWSDTEIICKVPVRTEPGNMESSASGPVTVITSAGQTSNPYIFKVTFGYGLMKWPDKVVPFKINENLASIDDEAQAIKNAANTWNNANSGFVFQYDGSHDNTAFNNNSTNEISWGALESPGTIGRASIWSTGGIILECDIVFNQDYHWSTSIDVPYTAMDIETVALHELGHWLNLRDLYGNLGDEEYDKAKVLYGFGSNGSRKRSLHQDDWDGINWIYGRPATFNISGYVKTMEGVGVEDVTLSGLPGNPLTNSSGYYSADVDNGWTGTVTPQKTRYLFAPLTHNYSNQSSDAADQDFTAYPFSTDATLSGLKIDGNTVTGFSASVLAYQVELPYGTITVPLVTATTTHARATKVITPAPSLPGTTSVVVTAEDGIAVKIYTISFTVAKNHDASLSNLLMNGSAISGFEKATYVYSITLPYGSVNVPVITATTTDLNATKLITPTVSLPGSTTVRVTAENGTTVLIYTINFTIALPSTDASLADLKVDGNIINEFSPEKTSYHIELPYRTTNIPVITASAKDTHATVIINATAALPGITTVSVTAEDGITNKTYSVEFTLAKNSDATLSDLMINGTTIPGFSPSVHSYQSELPYGTEKVPVVTAISNDGKANMVITPPESLPGTTLIHIVAENGINAMDYSVNFTIKPPSHDATLLELKVNGLKIEGFISSVLNYSIVCPHGLTNIPVLSATASQANAALIITDAQALPGISSVKVTAQDGTTSLTYSVTINVAKNDDATLADLKVDGLTIDGFQPSQLFYTLILPSGTLTIPAITATATDESASIIVSLPAQLPGLATVKVTAEDGSTFQTYEITLRYPLSGINTADQSVSICIFPNPCSGIFQITYKTLKNSLINLTVIDPTGRVLYTLNEQITNLVYTREIQLTNPTTGIYFIRFIDGVNVFYRPIIIN
jgi:hypothetical protein